MASTAWNAPLHELAAFQGFKREDGRFILSPVIPDSKEWFQVAYLTPHEPIRRDIIEVEDILNNGHIKENEPWKLINFFNWYDKRFLVMVHLHHDGEEDVFFPFFVKKVKEFPQKQSADHKTLIKLLDEITAIGKEFRASGTEPDEKACAKALPLLRAKWSELKRDMFPHVNEEEEFMLSTLKDVMTSKEQDALVQSVIKHSGIRGSRLILPSILESLAMWGTKENSESFWGELPPPIRFIAKMFWIPAHQQYHREALQSLRTGAPKQTIRDWMW